LRIPRDVSGERLARAFSGLGYEITRQTGSHMRLTTQLHGEHHVTIPRHDQLRVGTVAAVVAEVARHHGMTRDEVLTLLS
jgi:predicted RNA binding protein YcfA (HicA-like mRNA interferase family)